MRYVTDVVAVRRLFRFLGSGRVNHVADMGKREYTHLLDSQSAAHIAVFRLLIVFLSQVPRRATFSRPPFSSRNAEMPNYGYHYGLVSLGFGFGFITAPARLHKTKPKQRTRQRSMWVCLWDWVWSWSCSWDWVWVWT